MLAYVDREPEEAVRVQAAELIRLEASSRHIPSEVAALDIRLVEASRRYQQEWAMMQGHAADRSQKRLRDTAPGDYESTASAVMHAELSLVGDAHSRWHASLEGAQQTVRQLKSERVRLHRAVHAVNAERSEQQLATEARLAELASKAKQLELRLDGLREALVASKGQH